MGENAEVASSFVEIIAGIGSSMGLNSVSQPVSRNVVPYAVAKKEKNMMTKHSLYVFIILLSIYFVTLHIML